LVFPLATIGSFLLLTGSWRDLRPLVFWKGWLVFLGLGLPWHLWIAHHQPGYLWFHFIHEQFLRFLNLRTIKDSPLSTFVFTGLLIPLLFPWSLYLPQSLYFHFKQWQQEKILHKPVLFVLLWATVVIGFFSLSKFKLDYYSLPAWPALMLIIAHSLSSRMKQPGSGLAFSIPVAFIIFLGAAGWLLSPIAVKYYHLELPDPWFLGATQKTFSWLFLGSLAASFFLSLRRFKTALLCLAASMLPIMALAQQGMIILGPTLSNKDLAQAANRCLESLPASTVLAHAETDEDIYVGSAVFYTGRKIWLVMPHEKQVFPLGRTFYLTPQELSSWWRKDAAILLMGHADRISKLLANYPAYFLSKSGDQVLAVNQPVCGARKSSPVLVQYPPHLVEGT
jgi:4-amino-4-deoxy-L-arabinose transferase-like glycosyltransferase